MSNPEDDENITIKVYKHVNFLKNKLGMRIQTNEEGHIDPKQIKDADKIITEMCKNCHDTIGIQLDKLAVAWKEMREIQNPDTRSKKAKEIFTIAHEIKDISALCGYTLAAHFAESLRDYIAETALNLKNQQIIIQAHIDAMNVVHKNNIKEDAGPAAEELKKMVKIAIEKYH